MTQEEKQLLLKDLSARLLYGVKINYATGPANHCIFTLTELNVKTSYDEQYDLHYYPKINGIYNYFDCLPYLRPISSMTEEEKKKFSSFFPGSYGSHWIDTDNGTIDLFECQSTIRLYLDNGVDMINWLNKKMFDYRGLIPLGLALEASEEMYKTELL